MRYRFKKWQILRKEVENVPKEILEKIYNRTLSLSEYIEYQLENKIPTSCLRESDRLLIEDLYNKGIRHKIMEHTLTFDEFIEYQLEDKIPIICLRESDRLIVERFGIERSKQLDWELINTKFDISNYNGHVIDVREVLLSINPETDDINKVLYELVKDQINPCDYSSKMKEVYPDRLFENPDNSKKDNFNRGKVGLGSIVRNWNLYKNKDLSYCLLKDTDNEHNITDKELKEFMSKYGKLAFLIINHSELFNDKYISTFIKDFFALPSKEEKKKYIKDFTDDLLSKTINDQNPAMRLILTNDEYKEIFKYSSLKSHIESLTLESNSKKILNELKTLPKDYLYNMPFPLSEFFNKEVLKLVAKYGIKNIVDFDNECGQFFSKDNCKMLKAMYEMYVHYGGSFIEQTYTKEQFYEEMSQLLRRGSSSHDSLYINKKANIETIEGEFREKNKQLFLPQNVPDELKKLFYSGSITPRVLIEHPDYIQHLKGKDLSSCFEKRTISIGFNNENLYTFLERKFGFEELMKFLKKYWEALELIYDKKRYDYNGNRYELRCSEDDGIEKIEAKVNKTLRRVIIETGIPYPTNLPDTFMTQYKNMFLGKDAPPELKEALYSRTLTAELILSNPKYLDHLKGIDLEVLFRYMPIGRNQTNFVYAVKQVIGDKEALDIMLTYGRYIERVFDANKLRKFYYDEYYTKEDFLDEIDDVIYQSIIDGDISYDESIPDHFKSNFPTLFLDKEVSQTIKDKFYNRKFTIKDFEENPNLIDLFDNTNIACAFPKEYAWIINLFNDPKSTNHQDIKDGNNMRFKVITEYEKVLGIYDDRLRQLFKNYIINHRDNLDEEKIKYVSEVLIRLEYSNSIELTLFKYNLAEQLLATDEPVKNLEKIEDVFLRDNVPLFGKMFLCFNILYPDVSKIRNVDFSSDGRMSPDLKDETLAKVGFNASNNDKRLLIIFNDLLRISYRSNERSLLEYLDNIEKGNELYLRLQSGNISINDLSSNEQGILKIFVSHLETLYEQTKEGKEKGLNLEELPLEEKIKVLSEKFKINDRYDLKDRIVRSFCFMAGIKSFDELKQLVTDSRKEQEERINNNLEELNNNGGIFRFEEGDFVRGIGDIRALSGSINPGNYCKEHLGVFNGTSETDTTPLDVDCTLITKTDNIYEAIKDTPTGFGFGNIYVIIKKDNPNFYNTRDKDGNLTGAQYDPKKSEIFGTKITGGGYETHWGIRTGISFADVDYILYKKDRIINDEKPYDENGNVNYCPTKEENINDDRYNDLLALKYEIAKNGYYIPVIDFSGKLIFTKEEFKELRNKMQGLSHFNEKSYKLSEELINPEILEIASTINKDSKDYTEDKRNQVNAIVKEVLDEMGLTIKYKMDGDLSNNSVEFIDTGSTGRDTNVPYDGDFDFFMRLDAEIMRKPSTLNEFKKKLEEKFREHNIKECYYTDSGDLRIEGLPLKDGDKEIDVKVDISFGVKTSKVKYSSDECLRDRLSTIKGLYPDQYEYVVANIIKAKKFLKDEAKAYKPHRTDKEQGGLGGIGIENWILQNGGSFTEACRTFIKAATDEKTGKIIPFEEFKKKYQIWDFGENHFSARKEGQVYLYDNFVEKNMNATGYNKMVEAINKYLKTIEVTKENTESKKR